MNLQEKIAIVTGSSRGIGLSVAHNLHDAGARVILTSRKQENLEEALESFEEKSRVDIFACHAGDDDQVEALMTFVNDRFGRPNVLVNNAATNPHFGPFLEVEWPAWDKTFDVNVKGYFRMIRAVAKPLLEAEEPGSIINVSSIYGLVGGPFQGVYAMTKAAIVSMTESLAIELGRQNIRINAICPGLVETKFAAAMLQTDFIAEKYKERAALGRWAQPEEIAQLVAYLASDDASYVTGQAIAIDGGYLIGS